MCVCVCVMDGGTGSSTYASRLKAYPAKGVCGLPELHETDDAFARKVALLCDWWSAAKKIVVLTGAGISTSAGISDFRGPTGVWTLEIQREKAAKAKRKRAKARAFGRKRRRTQRARCSSESSTSNTMFAGSSESGSVSRAPRSFKEAKPTTTHHALTWLANNSLVDRVVTQNVDGLHQRAGLARSHLSILHGCVFETKCEKCGQLYFDDAKK